MPRARALSGMGMEGKEPHSVSLKVIRLSRPSLSYQNPLPNEDGWISKKASLSYPSDNLDSSFALSPNLTLPTAFGSAYVGETFACSLCANNELPPNQDERSLSAIHIFAEMKTPSQNVPLSSAETAASSGHPDSDIPSPAVSDHPRSLQRIVTFELKEEGDYVLAVNVSYTETFRAPNSTAAAQGRVRTFRKLYQFNAQPCLGVRTKTTELVPQETENRTLGPYGKARMLRFALEAQLENVGDDSISLGEMTLTARPPFKALSLNWGLGDDITDPTDLAREGRRPPLLKPRDVLQLAFLVEQQPGQTDGIEGLQRDMARDGRTCLGQLSIGWRGAMGARGFLTTGGLMSKRRALS